MMELLGGLGGAEMGVPGTRATPLYQPTPNSEPTGSFSGAPPRTRFFSMPIMVGTGPTQIVSGTRENRVVLITPPPVGFTVFVGDEGVSVGNGMALLPGVQNEVLVVGLQPLYAVSNAPVPLTLQLMISIVLAAERERR